MEMVFCKCGAVSICICKDVCPALPKHFVVETDHNNLLWIESSASPKVIRWRVYLQGFNFEIRHI
jgi:hypothetical protein